MPGSLDLVALPARVQDAFLFLAVLVEGGDGAVA